MTSKQCGAMLGVAAVFGLVGGAAATRFGLCEPARADAAFVAANAENKTKVVSAQEIKLVDDEGKVRARLAVKDDAEKGGATVSLMLYDANGKDRFVAYAGPLQTGFELHDNKAKARVVVSETTSSQGSRCMLQMLDSSNEARVKLELSSFGALTSILTNANGAGSTLVASQFKDKPQFQIVGNGGNQVWKAP